MLFNYNKNYLIGDPKYHIPSLVPLEIPEIKINPAELKLDLTNVKVFGLDAVKELDDFNWDKKGAMVIGSITIPKFEIVSTYKVSGRILVLPIMGEGPFKISMGKYCPGEYHLISN